MKRLVLAGSFMALFAFLLLADSTTFTPLEKTTNEIIVVHSYKEEFWVTDLEIRGLLRAFGSESIPIHTKQTFLDAKSQTWNRMTEQEKISLANNWAAAILAQQPELVLIFDDAALKYIGPLLRNRQIPVVFAGINGNPNDYGVFNKNVDLSRRAASGNNITGVLERIPFEAGFHLLKDITGVTTGVRVFSDKELSSQVTRDQLLRGASAAGIQINTSDFTEVEKFRELQRHVIAANQDPSVEAVILYLPWALDADHRTVVRWFLKNNRKPDVGFTQIMGEDGMLCGAFADMELQGYFAGLIAVRILKGLDRPSTLPIYDRVPKKTFINVARARTIEIDRRIPFSRLREVDFVYAEMRLDPDLILNVPVRRGEKE